MTLKEKILAAGIENCFFILKMKPLNTLFFISYTSSSDPEVEAVAKIDEKRYKVEDGYKVTLKPLNYPRLAKEDFYLSDLEHMINDGQVKFLVQQTIR